MIVVAAALVVVGVLIWKRRARKARSAENAVHTVVHIATDTGSPIGRRSRRWQGSGGRP